MKKEALLWTGIVSGPFAWFVNLTVSFVLAPLACTARGKLLLHLAAGISLLLTFAAGCLAFSQWQMPERNAAGEAVPCYARRRALAMAGMGLSSIFLLAILAQAIPNFVLGGCE